MNNQYAATVTVLPITSSIRGKVYSFEVEISAAESGLPSASKIKANQIRTIDKSRINNRIGKLSIQKIKVVEKALLVHLGINTDSL